MTWIALTGAFGLGYMWIRTRRARKARSGQIAK
jgi:hypothetical protein